MAGARALEPTPTEDRGLAWSGSTGQAWLEPDKTWQRQGSLVSQRRHRVRTAPRQAALVCQERAGPTPHHPEPGRETVQRRGYWGDDSLGDEVDAPVLLVTRRGAVAARRAHNPKVDGSNPSAATKHYCSC